MKLPRIAIVACLVLLSMASFTPVYAQALQYGLAETLNLTDVDAVDGDIVKTTEDGQIVRSDSAYDQRMFGVVVENPVVVYRTNTTLPITRSGTAYVNTTTINGPISVGDFVTSSEIPGKAQVANELTGYVLGIALEPLAEDGGVPFEFEGDSYQLGQVKVAVGIGPASPVIIQAAGGPLGTLTQLISAVFFNISRSQRLDRLIRFLLAAIIIVLTVYMSYRAFGKNVTKGIEAIGRNPLAKVSIQSMIVLNLGLILFVVLGGIVLALLIISL